MFVDLWGLYVAPKKLDGNRWNVRARECVCNSLYEDANVNLCVEILKNGQKALTISDKAEIPMCCKKEIEMTAVIEKPILWSLDNPYQYTAVVKVTKDGIQTDEYKTKFGFRYFSFDEKNRFVLNGKVTQINGVCAHQDFGFCGKAVSDNLNYYKIEQIKKMGANGYRCSHYSHTNSLMDADRSLRKLKQ